MRRTTSAPLGKIAGGARPRNEPEPRSKSPQQRSDPTCKPVKSEQDCCSSRPKLHDHGRATEFQFAVSSLGWRISLESQVRFWGVRSANLAIVCRSRSKTPVFPRLRSETGFDQLARISASVTGKHTTPKLIFIRGARILPARRGSAAALIGRERRSLRETRQRRASERPQLPKPTVERCADRSSINPAGLR
jgi:hypothetical protein